MTLRQFYDWQTLGGATDVSRLVGKLEELGVAWCMIGGLAVNHWTEESMATADVDFVIATDRIEEILVILEKLGFAINRHIESVILKGQSKLVFKIITKAIYHEFVSRSVPTEVHGILMRVASLEDTLAVILKSYSEPRKRSTKKLKDLLEISRLLDAHPSILNQIPAEIYDRMEK